jgi:hypothetical protein
LEGRGGEEMEMESARVGRYYRKILFLDEVGIAKINHAQKLQGKRMIFICFIHPINIDF